MYGTQEDLHGRFKPKNRWCFYIFLVWLISKFKWGAGERKRGKGERPNAFVSLGCLKGIALNVCCLGVIYDATKEMKRSKIARVGPSCARNPQVVYENDLALIIERERGREALLIFFPIHYAALPKKCFFFLSRPKAFSLGVSARINKVFDCRSEIVKVDKGKSN